MTQIIIGILLAGIPPILVAAIRAKWFSNSPAERVYNWDFFGLVLIIELAMVFLTIGIVTFLHL